MFNFFAGVGMTLLAIMLWKVYPLRIGGGALRTNLPVPLAVKLYQEEFDFGTTEAQMALVAYTIEIRGLKDLFDHLCRYKPKPEADDPFTQVVDKLACLIIAKRESLTKGLCATPIPPRLLGEQFLDRLEDFYASLK